MNLCKEIKDNTKIKRLVMIGIRRKGENYFKTRIDPFYAKHENYLEKDKKIYAEVII